MSASVRMKQKHLDVQSQNLSRYQNFTPNAEKPKLIMISRTASIFSLLKKMPRKQISFFTSLRGSLTLEAALVMPAFVWFLCAFLYFILLIGQQITIQKALETGNGSIVMYAGAVGDNDTFDDLLQLASAEGSCLAACSGHVQLVDGGLAGLDFSSSYADRSSQKLILRVSYQVTFPLGILGRRTFSFIQQSSRRLWSGSEGTSWTISSEEENADTVYVTENGSVYHLYADCTYLKPVVTKVARTELETKRSLDGSIYYVCSSCGDLGKDYVYITSYGTRFHSSLACPELCRNVRAISADETGSLSLCSKCRSRGS